MQIPAREIRPESPPVRSLGSLDPGSQELAVYGSALLNTDVSMFGSLTSLWLSGAPEQVCRTVGGMRSLRRLVVHDWRAADLRPLSALASLQSLVITRSSRLKALAGIEHLKNLEILILFDNCGYKSINELADLSKLKTLCLEGGFSKLLQLETFEPLSLLSNLERLRLASVRVADKSLMPLRSLGNLREVFVAKTFAADQLRGLAAALPLAKGEFLDSYRDAG